MKYEVELVMTEIGNCWCQKPQLTGIPCDNLLIVHSEGWITLSTLVHIIPSSTTLTHGLVIDVVMAINKIG
jgi:hypothetical protein